MVVLVGTQDSVDNFLVGFCAACISDVHDNAFSQLFTVGFSLQTVNMLVRSDSDSSLTNAGGELYALG